MKIHQTEIFGPVVVILKAGSLDEAIRIINDHPYGNGASIYTQNGYYARRFKLEARAGMIGINVGIPAPVAPLPFGGLKASLMADTKAQGKAAIQFFTDQKIITDSMRCRIKKVLTRLTRTSGVSHAWHLPGVPFGGPTPHL